MAGDASREMDKQGIEMMILSLNAPAIQAIHDTNRAVEMARTGVYLRTKLLM